MELYDALIVAVMRMLKALDLTFTVERGGEGAVTTTEVVGKERFAQTLRANCRTGHSKGYSSWLTSDQQT